MERIEGTLSQWNDDRGFGFITPTEGGEQIFIHISVFPRNGGRPRIGERLTFEIEIDGKGKKRAKNVVCPERMRSAPERRPARYREKKSGSSFVGRAMMPIMLLGLGLYGYQEYFSQGVSFSDQSIALPAFAEKSQAHQPSSSYRCDGRTHCSQMKSCEEAKFFLRNCPNVKMDGNNDGVPCEKQWCTSFFAR